MDEVRRLAYLSAMGIDCYARREPGAVAPETSVESTVQQIESGSLPKAPAQKSAVSKQASRVAELKNSLSATVMESAPPGNRSVRKTGGSARAGSEVGFNSRAEAKDEAKVESKAEESVSQVDHEQLRFSLQFYRVSEQLAVINEVPYLGSSSSEKEAKNLLLAVLRAIGHDLTQLSDSSRFNWPLSTDDDASMSRATEAWQALEGFLVKRLGSNFFDVIIVFGSQCEDLFNSSCVKQLLEESSNSVIYTHSIDSMLKIPALKRSVWESIRVIPKLL